MKKILEKVVWIVLTLTVIGLAITEYHFWRHDIDAAKYTELVMFLYGGGVLGKLIAALIMLIPVKLPETKI